MSPRCLGLAAVLVRTLPCPRAGLFPRTVNRFAVGSRPSICLANKVQAFLFFATFFEPIVEEDASHKWTNADAEEGVTARAYARISHVGLSLVELRTTETYCVES
jgi:hypothetical protein